MKEAFEFDWIHVKRTIALGMYRLKNNRIFHINCIPFTLLCGSEVLVKKIDMENRNVLIDFGQQMMGWYPYSVLLMDFEFVRAIEIDWDSGGCEFGTGDD